MNSSVSKVSIDSEPRSLVLDTVRSPWLLDHRFRSLCIAPGATLVAAILENVNSISDIEFLNMIPISEHTPVSLAIHRTGEKCVISSVDGVTTFAECQVTVAGDMPATTQPTAANTAVVQGSKLYAKLDHQGNQYGSAFQCISSIEAIDDTSALAVWTDEGDSDQLKTTSTLIDSLTHVLGFSAQTNATYFFKKIKSLQIHRSLEGIKEAGIHLTSLNTNKGTITGNFSVFDRSGTLLLTAKSVSIELVDENEQYELAAIASTFTADPMLDVFEFWNRKFGVGVRPVMAEYGQVFQSLISQDSPLANDSVKSRTLLVRLDDLAQKAESNDANKIDEVFFPDNLDTRALPDGRKIAHLNKYETDYLYQEIFVDLAYRRHNVRVLRGDMVMDIGANIGLFSLFSASEAEDISVIAIEPSPIVLPILKANLSKYVKESIVIEGGASSAIGEAEFTAYKKSSVFSSFAADKEEDHEAIAQVIRNTLVSSGYKDEKLIEDAVAELMSDRMDSEKYLCKLISVSDVIDQHNVKKIDLLKIDAEKSEEAILAGIRDEHWALIDQVIIEVHLQSGSDVNVVLDKLNNAGFVCIEDEEELLEDSGLVTIYAARPERMARNESEFYSSEIEQSAGMLIDAIDQFSQTGKKNIDIVLCPSDTRDPDFRKLLEESSSRIKAHFESSNLVTVLDAEEYSSNYPVEVVHDPVSNAQGHIPYTKEWYAALTTTLVRKQTSSNRMPYKVLVLDCDNTIWDGVAGEDGAKGVVFQKRNLDVMQFAVECQEKGMLVCLASKNDEDTVKEVFTTRASEMPLKWEALVSTRINWDRKSTSLRSLANELNVGLDSFVFIDDSPVECVEVMQECVDSFVLQFPTDEDIDVKSLLHNLWIFDQSGQTKEDSARASMYRDEQKRQTLKNDVSSLADFIKKLEINTSIEAISDHSVERASQMTMRTNQFNLSTKRRSVEQLLELSEKGYSIDIIKVADRFGDYGITGLAIYNIDGDSLAIDTLLLSCRVLGRGVEYTLLNHLVEKARAGQVNKVSLPYIPTPKNEPVRRFLGTLANFDSKATGSQTLVLDAAGSDSFEPMESTEEKSVETGLDAEPKAAKDADAQRLEIAYIDIAQSYPTADSIASAVASKAKLPRPNTGVKFVPPANDAEEQLCELWSELLGFDEIGTDDNFFEMGGTSLKGVALISLIQSRLGMNVSVVNLFEKPTPKGLALVASGGADDSVVAGGKARGAARREARGKRPGSRRRGG